LGAADEPEKFFGVYQIKPHAGTQNGDEFVVPNYFTLVQTRVSKTFSVVWLTGLVTG
jgi:hypothetical protein